MYLLDKEIPASDMTALAAVASVDEEKTRLEKELEWLSEQEMTPEIESRLNDLYDRWDEACARSLFQQVTCSHLIYLSNVCLASLL
jgi:hypothetical protein